MYYNNKENTQEKVVAVLEVKVLYIAHYRENTGWSRASIETILAMDSVGIDVVCRAIKLNNERPELPERILELEQKSLDGVTHVIQHVLPHYMDINTQFHNIAMVIAETNSFGITGWPNNLDLFDSLWVPNTDTKELCQRETKVKDVHVIPHSSDTSKFNKVYEPLDIPELKNKFVFYFIGEFVRRKHLSALLRAFHAEFYFDEDVGLIVKTNKAGASLEETMQLCQQTSSICKEKLRKYQSPERYHDELFFCEFLSEQDLHRLHKTCDCFVNPSFGEAWAYPVYDSMAHGNLVISSNQGGPKDYIKGPGFLVDGETEACFGADPPFKDLQTANEEWFNISIPDLQRKMRAAFNLSEEESRMRRSWGRRKAQDYSHKEVGQKIKDVLNV